MRTEVRRSIFDEEERVLGSLRKLWGHWRARIRTRFARVGRYGREMAEDGRAPRARRARAVVLLSRHVGEGRPPAMHWRESHPTTIRRFKAEVTCSRGHGIALRSHSVEADGRVVPSIVCREPGCDFHEIVRLDGWTAGRMPATP